MKKIGSPSFGVTSVVGSILLVAIVFIMGSAFAGLVLTTNFEPEPSAVVEVNQTNSCEKGGDNLCRTVVTVSQMSNADYVVATRSVPSGASVPTQNVEYESLTPTEVGSIPDNPAGTSTLDSATANQGRILVGEGDKYILESDPGTDILMYAGLEGTEDLMLQYEVKENVRGF